jgi:hypothetical protein
MSKKRIVDDGIRNSDIHWVLTVPAIWNDAAKQFMREAAEEVFSFFHLILYFFYIFVK